MGTTYGQLAAVSAFLCGFVVTFLAVLTISNDRRRRVGVALVIAVGSAASLLVAALGWGMLASLAGYVDSGSATDAATRRSLDAALGLTAMISRYFVGGIALLVALLGLAGWLRSRAAGLCTTAIAVAMAFALTMVLSPFVTPTSSSQAHGGQSNTTPR